MAGRPVHLLIISSNVPSNYPDHTDVIITYGIYLIAFQNSTSNKYHLSGLELSAALPDMASKSVLNSPCMIEVVVFFS